MDERAVHERVGRVEEALEELEGLPPDPRRTALTAVSALVELYGEGWARVLERLETLSPGTAAALAEDELVGHLLMIHGLHPEDPEIRIRAGLDALGGALGVDPDSVELLGVQEGVAHLRLASSGGPAVRGARELVREAVLEAAPELDGVELDLPSAPEDGGGSRGLVQLRVSDRLRREDSGAGTEVRAEGAS